jgi:AraC-like DNA-binding protein
LEFIDKSLGPPVLGFEEAANMTKFFKNYEGISPKEFKENLSK